MVDVLFCTTGAPVLSNGYWLPVPPIGDFDLADFLTGDLTVTMGGCSGVMFSLVMKSSVANWGFVLLPCLK